MGGKSRKTGSVSKKLIDRLKAGRPLKSAGNNKKETPKHDPFGLSNNTTK
jgi:hypothetical protein